MERAILKLITGKVIYVPNVKFNFLMLRFSFKLEIEDFEINPINTSIPISKKREDYF